MAVRPTLAAWAPHSSLLEPWFIPMSEPWRNSMVEKFNEHYQQKFLGKVFMTSETELREGTLAFEQRHNSKYRYSKLGGKTPLKALSAPETTLRFPNQKESPRYQQKKPKTGRYHLVRLIRNNLKLNIFGELFPVALNMLSPRCHGTLFCPRCGGTQQLGFTSDNVTGQTLKELIDKGLIPKEMDYVGYNSASRIDQVEFSIKRSGHPAQFIRAEYSKMHTATGLFSGVVIILQDVIHDRKLDRLKNEFISTAAHELRTPLTTLLGYIDILLDSDLKSNFSNEQKEEFLNEIHSKGETLSVMIDDLLDISRIEAGQPL